jgi:hypothetical protein
MAAKRGVANFLDSAERSDMDLDPNVVESTLEPIDEQGEPNLTAWPHTQSMCAYVFCHVLKPQTMMQPFGTPSTATSR